MRKNLRMYLDKYIEVMNKKLRLLVTAKCHNKCPMCCNNQFDFEKIPVVDRLDYEEISITGGEPLLPGSGHLTTWLVGGIQATQYAMGLPESKFYLYTAFFDFDILRDCSYEFDGICLTPHKKVDVEEFIDINAKMLEQKRNGELNDCFDPYCSLRLNLFADMKALLPKGIDLSLWKVKDMERVKDCPVPEGEDFRRIKELF